MIRWFLNWFIDSCHFWSYAWFCRIYLKYFHGVNNFVKLSLAWLKIDNFPFVMYFVMLRSGAYVNALTSIILFIDVELHAFSLQVFDGLVVLVTCVMELLFTIFWNDVICYHVAVEAATYVVVLRFCRIPRACSGRKWLQAIIEFTFRNYFKMVLRSFMNFALNLMW